MGKYKSIITALVCSLIVFSNFMTFTQKVYGEEVVHQGVRLIHNAEFYSQEDDKLLGELYSDTELYILKIEGNKVYFQWNKESAWIDVENIVLEENQTNDFQDIETDIYNLHTIKSTNEVVVFKDDKFDKQIASIMPEIDFSVSMENESMYEVIIGNIHGFIDKNAVFLSDTKVQEIEKAEKLISIDSDASLNDLEDDTNSQEVKTLDVLPETQQIVENQSLNFKFDKHFKVTSNKLPVYRENSSQVIAELLLDKEYIRVGDSGDWHLVKVGNEYGYVWKAATVPSDGSSISNASNGAKTLNNVFIATTDMPVIDVSSGRADFIVIKQGQKYGYIDEDPYWYKVDILGRIGYVNKYGTKKEYTGNEKYFKALSNKLPVYQENSKTILVELKLGDEYPIYSDAGDWLIVKAGNKIGYVWKDATAPADGLSIKNKTDNSTPTGRFFEATIDMPAIDTTNGRTDYITLKKGQKYEIYDEDPYWYKVVLLDRIGFVNKYGTKRDFSYNDKFFQVNVDKLEVYPENSKDAFFILNKNQEYQRIADAGDWHLVKIGNRYGYVWKAATEPSNGVSITNLNQGERSLDKYFTTTSDVIVYDTSVSPKAPFGFVKTGKQVAILEEYEDWYKIDVLGRIGFVNKSGTKKEFAANDKFFKVAQDKLPVYVNRGNTSVPVAELMAGEEYVRVSDAGDWHYIRFGNEYGYVFEAATEPSNGKSIEALSSGVKQSTIQLLTLEDTIVITGSGKTIGMIKKGESYPILNIYADHYEIDYLGRIGYVYKTSSKIMNIVNPKVEYTYDQMLFDINLLKTTYPDFITTEVIGKSVDGRDIVAVKVGKGTSEIMFNGSHHAREHITTNLLMEMIDQYAQSYSMGTSFFGYDTRSILNSTSIWFVPMVNPDGVTLVQKGYLSAKNPNYVLQLNNYSYDFSSWKANVRGVDLNRQYPADWENISGNTGKPSSQNFKGYAPLTEPEALALYNFTKNHQFKTATAYHSSGEILYWYFNQSGNDYYRDLSLANSYKNLTGYSLVQPKPNPSGGGFTDWFIQEMKLPGFTPEVSPYTYGMPVPISYFDMIWDQNKLAGLMLAQEAAVR